MPTRHRDVNTNAEPSNRTIKYSEKASGSAFDETAGPSRRYRKTKYPIFEQDEDDPICDAIGNYGRWQMYMNIILACLSFPTALQINVMQLVERKVYFWCERPPHLKVVPVDAWKAFSQPEGPCTIIDENWRFLTPTDIINNVSHTKVTVKCHDFEYDLRASKLSRIVPSYNLVCDRAHLKYLPTICFCFGMAIGGVISGLFSDTYGRKPVIYITLFIYCVTAASAILAKHIEVYAVLRLVQSMTGVSAMYAAFILLNEIVGGIWSTIVGVTFFLSFPLASVIVALSSVIIKQTQILEMGVCMMVLFFMATWFIVPESPKWLLAMGRKAEVEKLIRVAAKINRKVIMFDLAERLNAHKSSKTARGWMTIFKNPYLKRTILMFGVWFTITIVYFGSYYGMKRILWDNALLTVISSSMAEIPGMVLSIPLLMKVGRRIPICLTMCFCGITYFVTGLTDLSIYKPKAKNSWTIIPCVLAARFTIGTTSIMIVSYAAELYPVMMKNFGLGAGQMGTSISMILVPYLWKMAHFEDYTTGFVLCLICFIGAAITLLLPETHKPIKVQKIVFDTVEEKKRRAIIKQREDLHLIII